MAAWTSGLSGASFTRFVEGASSRLERTLFHFSLDAGREAAVQGRERVPHLPENPQPVTQTPSCCVNQKRCPLRCPAPYHIIAVGSSLDVSACLSLRVWFECSWHIILSSVP